MADLTHEVWAQIRYDYEHTDRQIEDICAEYKISSSTLRDRMRRWSWTRRRPPVPREGPPPVARPEPLLQAIASVETVPPSPSPSPQGGGVQAEPAAPVASGYDTNAPAAIDPAAIAPRLQSAVVRVLPAIEATIAKLAAGPQQPREMEQTARALGTLMRTLRELNALLSQHPLRSAGDYDDVPEDIDAFREQLAQKIEAFMESRGHEISDDDEDEPSGQAAAAAR